MFKIIFILYIIGVVIAAGARYIWPNVQDSTKSSLTAIFLWPVTLFTGKK